MLTDKTSSLQKKYCCQIKLQQALKPIPTLLLIVVIVNVSVSSFLEDFLFVSIRNSEQIGNCENNIISNIQWHIFDFRNVGQHTAFIYKLSWTVHWSHPMTTHFIFLCTHRKTNRQTKKKRQLLKVLFPTTQHTHLPSVFRCRIGSERAASCVVHCVGVLSYVWSCMSWRRGWEKTAADSESNLWHTTLFSASYVCPYFCK